MSMLRATTGASALAIAGMIAGCASPNLGLSQSASRAVPSGELGLGTRAHSALAAGDVAGAIALAERAVEKTPRDVTFRLLLANCYLAAGRFASAEAAYGDALALDPNAPSVGLKLVLSQIAQGKNDAALAVLDQLRDSAEPADIGLAMALAGQPGNAIALLDEAARLPGADGRTRQNLALAHALAGDWESARTVAAQDVPAEQLDARIASWMEMAKPGGSPAQVAALIGVIPAASDPGQPVRLALANNGQRLAASEPVPAPQPAAPPLAELAQAEPVVASHATVMNDPSFAAPPAPPAPVKLAAAEPAPLPDMAQTLDSLRTERVRPSSALPKVSELRRAAAVRFGKSKVVVQLGAYGSPASLQAGWTKLTRRHGALGRYTPATARFQAPIGTVYRLSLKGFASDGEARRLCQQLKSAGGACFVRSVAGDTPIRMASR